MFLTFRICYHFFYPRLLHLLPWRTKVRLFYDNSILHSFGSAQLLVTTTLNYMSSIASSTRHWSSSGFVSLVPILHTVVVKIKERLTNVQQTCNNDSVLVSCPFISHFLIVSAFEHNARGINCQSFFGSGVSKYVSLYQQTIKMLSIYTKTAKFFWSCNAY